MENYRKPFMTGPQQKLISDLLETAKFSLADAITNCEKIGGADWYKVDPRVTVDILESVSELTSQIAGLLDRYNETNPLESDALFNRTALIELRKVESGRIFVGVRPDDD